jgi:EcsC protein family
MTLTDDAQQIHRLPTGLWNRLRTDPIRSPEHISLAAAATFGPQAARWAADKRARFDVTPKQLGAMAKKRHATLARFEGAATGVGGVVTMVPDMAALAWIQSRLVFYVAAAYGYDPTDPMRPAEALVIFGFYPDPATARRALDGIGSTVVEAYIGSKLERQEALALRLGKMLGIRSARKLAGRLIPGVAIAFNAIGNERRTRALADRAIRFYGG